MQKSHPTSFRFVRSLLRRKCAIVFFFFFLFFFVVHIVCNYPRLGLQVFERMRAGSVQAWKIVYSGRQELRLSTCVGYIVRRIPTGPTFFFRSVGRSACLSFGRSVDRSVYRSVGRSVGLSVSRSAGRSFGRSFGGSVCLSAGLLVGLSVGRSFGRSFGRSGFWGRVLQRFRKGSLLFLATSQN